MPSPLPLVCYSKCVPTFQSQGIVQAAKFSHIITTLEFACNSCVSSHQSAKT